MSTPTKQDDRHEFIEVKPDYDEDEGTIQEVMEGGRKSCWQWFRIEVPKEKSQRERFFEIIVLIFILEWIAGPLIGMMLRSILGWPF